jgi:hypothetical protein
MVRNYVCYLHKRGALAPELRVIACDENDPVRNAILQEARSWGEFEAIEVFDDRDRRLFRLTSGEGAIH